MPLGDGVELGLLASQHLSLKRCPHCAVANPTISNRVAFDATPARYETLKGLGASLHWSVYACATCGGLVAAAVLRAGDGRFLGAQPGGFIAYWIVPRPRTVAASLPQRVAYYLSQAQETLTSPSASVVMSASAVDAILKDRGYREGSLHSRIEQAAA